MKRLLIVAALTLVALPAWAQTTEDRKYAVAGLASSKGQHVFVIDGESREWQGKLIKVSPESLEIDGESGLRRFELGMVKRVDADGDPVLDGLVKGAVFGVVVGAVFGYHARLEAMTAAGLTYGLIGLGMDALNHCKQTVYRGTASPQISMKVSW